MDVGSTTCSYALLRADKTPVGKPTTFANTAAGFAQLTAKRAAAGVPAEQILIGMEATGLYGENLYYWLRARG